MSRPTISRRGILVGAASLAATPLLAKAGRILGPLGTQATLEKFRFVYFCDPHIQPELGAAVGTRDAFLKAMKLDPKPDFIVTGGDHVFDVTQTGLDRANNLFDMFGEALKPIEVPVHFVVGNHDCYGWSAGSAVTASDPLYGKGMFQEKVLHGPTYSSFDFGSWHFLIIDDIAVDKKGSWTCGVDDDQLTWIEADLARQPDASKVVALTHIPLYNALAPHGPTPVAVNPAITVAEGAQDLLGLLSKYKVRSVLQAHTHNFEEVFTVDSIGQRTHFVTGGAVCGNWWKGKLNQTAEGILVCDVDGPNLSWEYVPYGWIARSV